MVLTPKGVFEKKGIEEIEKIRKTRWAINPCVTLRTSPDRN